MSTLPPINRISREDVRGAPTWIDLLLGPINLFFDAVYRGFNKGLTFSENLDCQDISFQLKAGAASTNNTVKFSVTMKNKPTGLFLKNVTKVAGNYSAIGAAVFIEWYYEAGFLNITSITGLTNGTTYNFLILLN